MDKNIAYTDLENIFLKVHRDHIYMDTGIIVTTTTTLPIRAYIRKQLIERIFNG